MKIEPGVYEDVAFEDYCKWDAVNISRLKLMERSPAHYLLNRPYDSESLLFGRLVHAGRLEPACIPGRYAILPSYHLDPENCTGKGTQSESKNTKYVREKMKTFRAQHPGKEFVTEHDYNAMLAMLKAICDNRLANQWFSDDGPVEVSVCWLDEETQLLCKARFDKLLPDGCVDLKTTRDAMNFERHANDYGYHLQAAFYLDGYASAFDGFNGQFRIVAVENNNPPYGVRSAAYNVESIEYGREIYRHYLRQVRACMDADNWPCYADPVEWSVPQYILDREMQIEI